MFVVPPLPLGRRVVGQDPRRLRDSEHVSVATKFTFQHTIVSTVTLNRMYLRLVVTQTQ